MKDIEVFVQGEGIKRIEIVRLPSEATVSDLLRSAHMLGMPSREGMHVYVEDAEEPLPGGNEQLSAHGVSDLARLHCHRCRKVEVTVNFNHLHEDRAFSPATTIAKVKKWADDKFNLTDTDATEHALQVCGSSIRPDEDVHIGTLVSHPACQLCFDLVPKVRVEG